jgi:TetR/AcrR family transcriptional repressor of nem operon
LTEGLTPEEADALLATLTGALVVANALGDEGAYDRATQGLLRKPTPGSSGQGASV